MASLSFTLAAATTTSCSPFFYKTPSQRRLKTNVNQTYRFQVSCNVASDDDEKPIARTNPQPQKLILPKASLDMHNVDRRNLLLGLGGLYSTVNLTGLPSAFAIPIKTPSFYSGCREAEHGIHDKELAIRTTACCPPVVPGKVEKPFEFPDPTRRRWPIHDAPPGYLEKFQLGIKKMKELPDDDPRSFKNQAKIHCAYCNGSYTQIETGVQEQKLLVHYSWLFFPFHRWYLYFFERILGEMVGDSEFGLPYWSWDEPDGMEIPDLFEKKTLKQGESNPLYDIYRNQNHSRPAIINLDYDGEDHKISSEDQKHINTCVMNRQMKRNAFDTDSFFGGVYVSGNGPTPLQHPSVGSIEAGCHTAIHRWVGNPRTLNGEDLGNFYSAGYDPLFYVHHANVDRMWTLWKDMAEDHIEPSKEDWRDASYVFYDEKQNPVRVTNGQCVDLEKLHYKYEGPKTPSWMNTGPKSKYKSSGITIKSPKELERNVKLSNTVTLELKRPQAAITRALEKKENDKEKIQLSDLTEIEMLLLNGIEFVGKNFVKFDVFVNALDDTNVSPCYSEYAGSFSAVPDFHNEDMINKTGVRFALTELLEEIEADGHESIQVTIVPRAGAEDVTIAEVMIDFY